MKWFTPTRRTYGRDNTTHHLVQYILFGVSFKILSGSSIGAINIALPFSHAIKPDFTARHLILRPRAEKSELAGFGIRRKDDAFDKQKKI